MVAGRGGDAMMRKFAFRSGALFILLNLASGAFAVAPPLPGMSRIAGTPVYEDPPPPAPQPPSHASAGTVRIVTPPGAAEDPPPPVN